MSDTAAAIIDAQRREQQAEARYEELLVRWREAQAEITRRDADYQKLLTDHVAALDRLYALGHANPTEAEIAAAAGAMLNDDGSWAGDNHDVAELALIAAARVRREVSIAALQAYLRDEATGQERA